MTVTRVPVCSPELLQAGPPISEPADLLHYPILCEEEAWDKWDEWFRLAGVRETTNIQGPRLGDAYLAIKAAEDGQGIALGTVALITEKVSLGRLAVLFTLATEPKLYYTLTYAKDWKHQPKVAAFREWLYAEIESIHDYGNPKIEPSAVAQRVPG